MNGLLSRTPSQSAIRLALGGFLLLVIQSLLLLAVPGVAPEARLLIWVITPLSFIAYLVALIGFPEPRTQSCRRRHGR